MPRWKSSVGLRLKLSVEGSLVVDSEPNNVIRFLIRGTKEWVRGYQIRVGSLVSLRELYIQS